MSAEAASTDCNVSYAGDGRYAVRYLVTKSGAYNLRGRVLSAGGTSINMCMKGVYVGKLVCVFVCAFAAASFLLEVRIWMCV